MLSLMSASGSDAVRKIASAAAALGRAERLDEVLEEVVEQAKTFGARAAHLLLAHEEAPRLVLAAHRDVPSELLDSLEEIALDSPVLAARAAANRSLMLIERPRTAPPELTFARALLDRTGSSALISAPLIASERLVGVLTFASSVPLEVGDAERAALAAIADMFAVAIDYAQRAQTSALRLRAVFDSSYQFIGLLAPDGTLLDANKKALEFAHVTPDDVVGQPYWETPWWSDSPEKQSKLRDAIERAAAGEVVCFEIEHVSPTGQRLFVDFSLSPVVDENGEVVLLVPEGRDITQRKELEQLRDEWVGVISHDLAQPSNAIKLWLTRIARRQGELDDQTTRALGHIGACVGQLDRMVRDLVDTTRLQANRLALRKKSTRIDQLVFDAVARFAPGDGEPHVRIDNVADPIAIDVDPGRLEQVIENLLSNAWKYGDRSAPIEARVDVTDSRVEIAISNRGQGIPADEVPRLFTRFHRTRQARDSGIPGTGLGLFIAGALVAAHGGRIEVESLPGETTTFRIALPR